LEREPQAPDVPQLTDQETPEFVVSFDTTAVSEEVAPTVTVEGVGETLTTIVEAVVIVAVAVAVAGCELDSVAFAVAVMVTAPLLPPPGTLEGAIYVATAPLAVLVEEKRPQEELLQLTVQSTPSPDSSLVTVAIRLAVSVEPLPISNVVGDTLIETVFTASIITVVLTDLLVSPLAVAIMVTVSPVGTVAGAV
jgi:hypothetical protein